MNFSMFELPDFVDIVDIMWIDRLDTPRSRHMYESGIFKIQDIGAGEGEKKLYDEIDREEYASRITEGGTADKVLAQQGYSKYMYSGTYGKDALTTYQFRTKNKFSKVIAKVQNIFDLPLNTLELNMNHRLTFATSTSYVDKDNDTIDVSMGDGLALASTSHTVSGSAATYRTILANNPRVSTTGLAAMEKMARENSINIFGQKIPDPKLDVLWTTDDPTDMNTVMEFLTSVGSTTNDKSSAVNNVNKGKYRHVYLPLVPTTAAGEVDTNKQYYWGLCSTTDFHGYVGFWRRPTLIGPFEQEDGSENVLTGARADWGITIVVARGFFMSKGDGAA